MLITVTNKMSKHWFHRISVCEFDLINLWTCLSWNTCAFYSEWYVELSYDVTREYFALNRSDSVPFIQPESAGWKRSLNTPGIKLFLKQRRFIHFMSLPRKWRLSLQWSKIMLKNIFIWRIFKRSNSGRGVCFDLHNWILR